MAENAKKVSPEPVVRAIRRQTRRKFSADEKIRIVLEGPQGESSIADLCRRESIHPNQYYTWSKEFLEAGKRRQSEYRQRKRLMLRRRRTTLGLTGRSLMARV